MKEIDFLPDWYKHDRRQQITYHTQYVALAGMFVLMLVSNFVTSRSVSKAEAQFASVQPMETAAKNTSAEFGGVSGQMAQLKKKADILKKIDSRINVGDVLAELSFLTGKKIALTRVEFIAEKFPNSQPANTAAGFAVRPAGSDGTGREETPLGNVKFKVVLGGIAGGASEVGEFVCRLEDSPYFCTVYPVFTRNKQIRIAGVSSLQTPNTGQISRDKEEGLPVSEFEIVCHLENFKEN